MSESIDQPAPDSPEAPSDDLRSVLSAAFEETDTGTPARDDRGRFASDKTDAASQDAADESTDQPETKADEPEKAIEPPQSWSDADKAHWSTLSREVQDTVLRRERDIDKTLAERAQETKEVAPLREVLTPYQSKFAMMGMKPEEAVRRLLAAQDALEQNPDKAFPELAKAFGYDLKRLGIQQPAQSQQQPQQFQDPRFDQFLAEQQASKHEQARVTVEAFAKDPANSHFEDVRAHMGRLVQADPTLSLKDAYEQAAWANPVTREKMLAETRQADEAKRVTAAKQRAEAAKRAGVSVRSGAPSGSATSSAADSLRAEIERAFS